MKLIAALFASLVMLASCSEDPVTTNNNNASTKPWLEIHPDSLNGTTNVFYTFSARVNNFDQDDVRVDWYFGEGDTVKLEKNFYWNNYPRHQYSEPGVYTITVTARDMFADTVIAKATAIATITN